MATRVIDAIDKNIIEVVAMKVEGAWNGDVMLTAADKARIQKV